jgi:formamidopyrimidine-DNA glycosylase
VYNDTRRFGFIKYYTATEFKNCSHLSKLGVEPLSDELNFSFFKRNIIRFNKSIKNTLMDQSFICGLGNIYVNEALFLSKINPNRSSLALHEKEIKVLINYIKIILKKSIAMGGSSIKIFTTPKGNMASFKILLKCMDKKIKSVSDKIVPDL